jgi:hypothetical protein
MVKRFMFALLVLGGCSTKANPNACCVSADDCSQAGLSTVTACDQGLTCVNNQCLQETCATDGCTAALPVCSAVTNACEGCTDSSQCASYPGQTVCDTSSGACVGCVAASDCPTDAPVCDNGGCRACIADSDCASGACADDGSCVDASEIVYLDPVGQDTGSCSASVPCKSLTYAFAQTSEQRAHIVMNTGAYVDHVNVDRAETDAMIYVHGGNSTVSMPTGNDGGTLRTTRTTFINLSIENDYGRALDLTSGELRNVHITSQLRGLSASGTTTLRDVTFTGLSGDAVETSGPTTLTFDRVRIEGVWARGIVSDFGANITVTNTLIDGTSDLAIDLSRVDNATLAFVTVADSGADSGTGPRAVSCAASVVVRDSIVWAPGTTHRVALQGCNVASSIIGPDPISGVSNADPQFVNASAHDYHLAPGSPARDAVDTGPATDFEGDPRPQGPKYDLGADEAR